MVHSSTQIDVWHLQRNDASARCVLRNIGDRLELHIAMTDDVVLSQQCAGPEQASAISARWRTALVERGWVEAAPIALKPKEDRRRF